MGVAFEMTKAYFDSKEIRYEERDEGVLRVGFGGLRNKGNIDVIVVIDDNDRTVSLTSYNVCAVPESKKDGLYQICSELNAHFRWVKFYVDEEDNTITARDDAIVQAESSGEEIHELIARMVGIVDDAYPTLMRFLWA